MMMYIHAANISAIKIIEFKVASRSRDRLTRGRARTLTCARPAARVPAFAMENTKLKNIRSIYSVN